MALRRLSTDEMIALSIPWVDRASDERRLLEAIPEVAPLLPRLDAAHAGLVVAQPPPDDTRLRELTVEAAGVDARHDALVRGLHDVLSGFANLAGHPTTAQRISALRERLLPEGIAAADKPYREEADDGLTLLSRLDPIQRQLLRELPIPGGTLEDAVRHLVATARNRWIRVVHTLVSNLALAGVGQETMSILLGPLHVAEQEADRRAGAGERGDVPDPTNFPTEPGG